MDKAREAVQAPAESLREALQATELSWGDMDLLRDYLLLRGEISRHREDPQTYEPPAGEIDRQWVEQSALQGQRPWPLISAFRKGSERVVEAAYRFGVGLDQLHRPDGHEAGRKWFPALADRLHLGAVIAKCGAFCAYAEAFVKNLQQPVRPLDQEQFWPERSTELVERYNHHLGLDLPQPDATVHEREVDQVKKAEVSQNREAVRPTPMPEREISRTPPVVSRDDDYGFDL